ncbi:hypothetical protein, partial [Enhygromyxa salina]|uniref:hypothetical protein n=1 Tax=Enhygromyxa salina TaxID=215803 RepID=UPI0011BA626A
MLDFPVIFNTVRGSLDDGGRRDSAHPLSECGVGVAASIEVLAAHPSGHPDSLSAQLGTQSSVFEGQLVPSRGAAWNAAEIVGNDFGIVLASSSIIPGYRAYVQNLQGANAIGFEEVDDNGTGYGVGQAVVVLAEGAGVEPLEIQVMYSVAGRGRLQADAAYSYDGEEDGAKIYLDGLYPNIAPADVVIFEIGEVIMPVDVIASDIVERIPTLTVTRDDILDGAH